MIISEISFKSFSNINQLSFITFLLFVQSLSCSSNFLMYRLLAVSEENGYESSIDNDDDISSDEDPDVVNKLEAEVSS